MNLFWFKLLEIILEIGISVPYRGDTNIKFLVNNNTSIWNGDAYKNYLTKVNNGRIYTSSFTQEEFINKIKTDDEFAKKWGNLGPIYGKQWRSWGRVTYNNEHRSGFYNSIDQARLGCDMA